MGVMLAALAYGVWYFGVREEPADAVEPLAAIEAHTGFLIVDASTGATSYVNAEKFAERSPFPVEVPEVDGFEVRTAQLELPSAKAAAGTSGPATVTFSLNATDGGSLRFTQQQGAEPELEPDFRDIALGPVTGHVFQSSQRTMLSWTACGYAFFFDGQPPAAAIERLVEAATRIVEGCAT